MLKFTIRLLPAMACLFLAGLLSVSGQTTNAAPAHAPAVTPPVVAIPLADVANQAQEVTEQLRDDQTGSNPDQVVQNIEQGLPPLTRKIDQHITDDARLFAATASLNNLQGSQSAWQSLSNDLNAYNKDLADRAGHLDKLAKRLDQTSKTWTATLASTQSTPNGASSAAVVQSIRTVLAAIGDTAKIIQANQAQVFSLQKRVADQANRIQDALDKISKAVDTARAQLFQRDHPPLWNLSGVTQTGAGIVAQERVSLREQISTLTAYLQDKIGAVLAHLFLLGVLIMGFYWIRNTVRSLAKEEAALQRAAQVFDVPLATALLLALLATIFLYPDKPPLLWAAVGAIALIPAVIVIRRLIDPANFFLLYATVIAYFVDQLRAVVTPVGMLLRFLFIAELLAASIFLVVALRSKSLSASPSETARLRRFTRIYLHLAFLVLVFAGFANVLGYVHLSILVGDNMLKSSYLAVIFYAGVRIVDALAISALSIRPLTGLGMVRRHRDLLYQNTSKAIRWLAFALWLLIALKFFTLRDPLWEEAGKLLDTHLKWGSLSIQVGSILAFPITVWASFLFSRFIRFCLEEEVYPHLQLGRGIPYAASTMVHYAILVVGFFVAVKASGGDLTQFSFLAGAFGVGLGFGLQNIFNNFVSGIILLFERPIKVGDIIQMDATTIGTVARIGIRASVITLTNGSEMIVPNGNLISNPVTNWTLSNCERLIEIPVNVSSKVDPQHVLHLLTETARAHPSVLKNPAPQALLATFGGATLSFRLRAWIDSAEEWMKITSDLSLAINAALARENIATS